MKLGYYLIFHYSDTKHGDIIAGNRIKKLSHIVILESVTQDEQSKNGSKTKEKGNNFIAS